MRPQRRRAADIWPAARAAQRPRAHAAWRRLACRLHWPHAVMAAGAAAAPVPRQPAQGSCCSGGGSTVATTGRCQAGCQSGCQGRQALALKGQQRLGALGALEGGVRQAARQHAAEAAGRGGLRGHLVRAVPADRAQVRGDGRGHASRALCQGGSRTHSTPTRQPLDTHAHTHPRTHAAAPM